MSDNSSSQRLIGLQGGAEVLHRYRFTANKTNTTRTVSFTDIVLLQIRQKRLVQFLSQISPYCKEDKHDSYSVFRRYRFTANKTKTARTGLTQISLYCKQGKHDSYSFFHKYRFTANKTKTTRTGLSQISLYCNKSNTTRTISFTDIALLQTRQKRLVQFFHKYHFTANKTKTTRTGLSQISLYCKQVKHDSYNFFHRYRFTANKEKTTRTVLSQISLYCKQDKNDSYSSFTDIALLQQVKHDSYNFFHRYLFTANKTKTTRAVLSQISFYCKILKTHLFRKAFSV